MLLFTVYFTVVFCMSRCLNDKCFLLCQECDKVFHKSTVKKSHIRIPAMSDGAKYSSSAMTPSGSLDKLHMSRENSSTLGSHCDDNEVALIDGTAPSVASALHFLARELNDICKQALVTVGVIDHRATHRIVRSSLRLHLLSSNGSAAATCADDPLYYEYMACVLAAGLRGILDDRQVK